MGRSGSYAIVLRPGAVCARPAPAAQMMRRNAAHAPIRPSRRDRRAVRAVMPRAVATAVPLKLRRARAELLGVALRCSEARVSAVRQGASAFDPGGRAIFSRDGLRCSMAMRRLVALMSMLMT